MKHVAAVAITTAPDLEAARRLYQLGDLDDASVLKILQHKNKQPGGERAGLRPHEQCVAAVSLAGWAGGEARVWTRTLVEHDEPAILRKLFDAARGLDTLVTWQGTTAGMPAARLGAFRHDLGGRAFFGLADDPAGHLDLARTLDPAASGMTLDALARALGLPGVEQPDGDPLAAVRGGDVQALRARGEQAALNLCLLALRHWRTRGDWSHKKVTQAEALLRALLEQAEPPHLRAFLAAWPGA